MRKSGVVDGLIIGAGVALLALFADSMRIVFRESDLATLWVIAPFGAVGTGLIFLGYYRRNNRNAAKIDSEPQSRQS